MVQSIIIMWTGVLYVRRLAIPAWFTPH